MSTSVLIVPGLHDSGPAHWQTLLERKNPEYRRVSQRDWDDPCLDEWADNLQQAVLHSPHPVFIVAHSFGCLVTARAALLCKLPIQGALLVAPANPNRFEIMDALPHCRLPFPSILVASHNDPWLSFPKACFWGATWGSQLVDLGQAGHINADAGFGHWPLGERLLQELMANGVARSSQTPIRTPRSFTRRTTTVLQSGS